MNDSFRLLLGPDPSEFTGGDGGSLGSGSLVPGSQPGDTGLPDSGITQAGDTPPSNGGPTRQDLSGATIDDGTGSGGLGGSAPAPADPNHAGWTGVRDAALARGFQFDGSVTDDAGALDHLMRLAQSNRQADYYAQLGRSLAPQAPAIQQYLQQQQAQQAQPAARPSWEAPEFDQRWASLVDRDPSTGIYVGKAGVPHDIVAKVNAYADWKQKFDQNPAQMINDAAEAKAKVVAQQVYREQFAAHQQQQSIQSIVQQNASWLYQVDPATGQQVRDFNNRPTYSVVGARYIHHLGQARQMGITDPNHQNSYAMNVVRGEWAQAQHQQGLQASAQASNPQTQQQLFRAPVNPSQALPPTQRRQGPVPGNEPGIEGLSLRDQIMRDLKAEGVTDADIMASVGGG